MKKGFTLAEVLITLVVIGIIAALTISTLMKNHEKKQLYVQFMKNFNTVSNALNLARIDHGDPGTWQTSSSGNANYLKTYVLPYVTNARVCDHMSDCFASNYKDLTGGDQSAMVNQFMGMGLTTMQLASGASLLEVSNVFVIDTNGKKKPNVYGRDIFTIELNRPDDTTCSPEKPFCPNRTPEQCVSSKGFEGDACYQKLLKDGKMDY